MQTTMLGCDVGHSWNREAAVSAGRQRGAQYTESAFDQSKMATISSFKVLAQRQVALMNTISLISKQRLGAKRASAERH